MIDSPLRCVSAPEATIPFGSTTDDAASATLLRMAKTRKPAAPRRPVRRKPGANAGAGPLRYTVIYEPQPEGGYTVSVPALPGCITEGDTIDEARAMAEDAIRGYCQSMLADGLQLPIDVANPPRHERLAVALSAR
jgi:predicted RNase H-like HicB family nuclease